MNYQTSNKHRSVVLISKKIILLILLVAIGSYIIVPADRVSGASLTDLQKQQQDLQKQITDNQKAAQQKQAEAQQLSGQISALDTDIASTQDQINQTSGQISSVNDQIAQLQRQINDTQKKLDLEKQKMNEVFVALYRATNNNSSTLFMLLNSTDIAEAMSGGTQLTSLQQQLDGNISRFNDLKADLDRKNADQQTRKTQLDQLKNQQVNQKRSTESLQSYKSNLLGMTVDQQNTYLANVDKLKSEITRVSAQIYAERQKKLTGGKELLGSGGSGYPYGAIDEPDAWNFLTRECTSYVAWYWNVKLGKKWVNTQPGRGSARYWPEMAGPQGYSVSSTPRVGAMISFHGPLYAGDQWGHVAIVEAVNGDGTIDVSEYNWLQYSYSYRKNVNPGDYGSYSYIY